MKKLLLSAILLMSIVSSSMSQNLEVQIDGWGNDTIYLSWYTPTSEDDMLDTIVAVDGRITYNLPSQDTCFVFLNSKRSFVSVEYGLIALEAMRISTVMAPGLQEKIVGKIGPRALEYTSSGSIPFFEQLAEVRSICLQYDIAADSLDKLIGSTQARGISYEEEEQYFAQRRQNYDKMRRIKLDYAMLHPNEDIAGYFVQAQRLPDIKPAMAFISPSVRNGLFKNYLSEVELQATQFENTLESKKSIVVGSIAPDFTLSTLDGGQASLSQFKGKWVLLDFWGSWCDPCIKGFDGLKKYHDKNKDKLHIIGIACHDTPQKCRSIVKELQLPWVQLIEPDNSAINTMTKYAVETHPTYILISPDGVITEIITGLRSGMYETLDQHILHK